MIGLLVSIDRITSRTCFILSVEIPCQSGSSTGYQARTAGWLLRLLTVVLRFVRYVCHIVGSLAIWLVRFTATIHFTPSDWAVSRSVVDDTLTAISNLLLLTRLRAAFMSP